MVVQPLQVHPSVGPDAEHARPAYPQAVARRASAGPVPFLGTKRIAQVLPEYPAKAKKYAGHRLRVAGVS